MRKSYVVFLLFGVYASASASTSGWCSTNKIELSDTEIRVFLNSKEVSGYYLDTSGKGFSTHYNLADGEEFFIMYEGDIAYLMPGAHSTCTLTATRQESSLGIQFKTVFRPPGGFPPDIRTKFVAATEPAEE